METARLVVSVCVGGIQLVSFDCSRMCRQERIVEEGCGKLIIGNPERDFPENDEIVVRELRRLNARWRLQIRE